jgi:hypothetical protein
VARLWQKKKLIRNNFNNRNEYEKGSTSDRGPPGRCELAYISDDGLSRKMSLLPVQKAEVCIPSLRGNFGLFVAELTTSLMEFDRVESRFQEPNRSASHGQFFDLPLMNAILRV